MTLGETAFVLKVGFFVSTRPFGDWEKRPISFFSGKGIRKMIYNNEWWFSVVDVCAILTECTDPGA